MGNEDDWFEDAAREVSETTIAKAVRERAEKQMSEYERHREEMDRLRAANRKTPGELAAARGQFEAVAAGLAPPHAPGYASGGYVAPPGNPAAGPDFTDRMARINPDAALAVILRAIRQSPDPMQAASEWLTKITNELGAIAREQED